MAFESNETRRQALLAAAPALARKFAPESLTAAGVAAAAGLGEADFHAEFPNVASYLEAVQLKFFEGRLARIVETATSMKPSAQQAQVALAAYLDYSLEHAAVHAWCMKARELFPELMAEWRKRSQGTLTMMIVQFRTLGWAHPVECARLCRALLMEVCKLECEVQAPLPAMRSVLWSCLAALRRLRKEEMASKVTPNSL